MPIRNYFLWEAVYIAIIIIFSYLSKHGGIGTLVKFAVFKFTDYFLFKVQIYSSWYDISGGCDL